MKIPDNLPPPLEKHETLEVHDSSKITAALRCKRLYFYEYVLGWRTQKPNHHLAVGTSIHLAMEHLLLNKKGRKYDPSTVEEAFDIYMQSYRKEIPSDYDLPPKTPGDVLEMLHQFVHTFTTEDFDVLYTEVGGSYPVDNTSIHFVIDAILKGPEGIYILDHKTTSRDSAQFWDEFNLSPQLNAYTNALYALYPPDEVFGAKINALIFRKSGHACVRRAYAKTPLELLVWYTTVRQVLAELQTSWNHLAEKCSASDDIMTAFPMNPTACTKYGTCPYHPYCTAWSNPLQHAESPPAGMCINRWDPRKKINLARYNLQKGKIKENESREEELAAELSSGEDQEQASLPKADNDFFNSWP